MIERFKQRSKKDFGPNSHYKSIVRSKAWLKEGGNPHYFGLLPGFVCVHTQWPIGLSVTYKSGWGLKL